MARREVTEGSKREVGNIQSQDSGENLMRYLEPQIIPFIENILNIPKTFKQAGEEMKYKSPFAAPSPELRKLGGGTSVDTGNRFLNATLDTLKGAQTATRAGGDVLETALLLRALIPYLTYGGVNRLVEKQSGKGGDMFKGRDLLNSVTSDLTNADKLGNDIKANKQVILGYLKNRVPGGFQPFKNYTVQDVYNIAKKVGIEEGAYNPKSPPGMVRSSLTGIVKSAEPATKIPYWVSTQLSQIPSKMTVPVVGAKIPSPFRNPWTWLPAGMMAKGPIAKALKWLGL